ncbi:QcrA and Rieske domain-containing protein [Larkinella soli]|uniref:QcrA and Rieske domain-containing protein n=1 Tax=Larkinella soli TaxID=1770527 RepID=UPI000FFCA4D5|nr:Rieske (2Fe-2S) protein [Larkinella soli]
METQKNETIKRGEFLRSLGMSSAALMAFYCMGTLTSCSKGGDDDPDPNNGGTGAKVDFTLDLNSNDFKILKETGGFAYKDNVLIARAKSGNYVALSKICTHENNLVAYRSINDDFYCATHGSVFDLTGKVTVPAGGAGQANLKTYKTALSGTNLRVFED